MAAVGTGLGGEWRGDLDQPTTQGCGLVCHEQLCSTPGHSKDCAVQSSLGPDIRARTGGSAASRAGHPSDVQVLDHDRAVAPGDLGCGLVDPIRPSTGLASPKRHNLAVRIALPSRRQGAGPLRSAPPGRLVLQRSEAALFSVAKQVRHVEVPPVREGHGVDDTEADPDGRSVTPSDGGCWLLDAEADVPAERILHQPAAGDATPTSLSGDRQGARPPKSHSSGQEDRDLPPSTIHSDDSKVGRLRKIDRHPSGPMLEPGRA